MSVISGQDGKVLVGATQLADIIQWKFKTTARNVSYISSSTAGYQKLLPGGKEGSGQFQFILNVTDAVSDEINEGDSVTLKLYVDDTHFYDVPARINSIEHDVDISAGAPIRGKAEFSTDGAWTLPSYA